MKSKSFRTLARLVLFLSIVVLAASLTTAVARAGTLPALAEKQQLWDGPARANGWGGAGIIGTKPDPGSLFQVHPAPAAVSIGFTGLTLESGTDCDPAVYRVNTNATYNGTPLDLLIEVTSENVDYSGTCGFLSGGLFKYEMDNGPASGTSVYAEFTLTIVEAGTNNPVTVDRLMVTFLDLDSSPNAAVGTDDVYLNLVPNTSEPFLREGTKVTYSEGSYPANGASSLPPGETYDVKFKGWGPKKTCTDTDAKCFGSAVFENTSKIYFRYENDSVVQQRGFLLSLDIDKFERVFNNTYDYGDAPTSYGAAGVKATAKYVLGTGLPADAEGSYVGSASADSDDADPANDPDYDDEGAVKVGGNPLQGVTLAPGSSYNMTVDVYTEPGNTGGYINAWFDWNGDGDFTDSGEQVISNQQVTASGRSTQTFTLTVPTTAQTGTTYARVTYTQSTRNSPTNTSGGIGEVEDYQLTINNNALPTAVDDTATTNEDTPVNINVLANDTFGGDGPSSSPITVTTNPSHGTATVNDNGTANDPTDDTVDYTPNANYNGTDTFDYQICDSNGDCDTATVTVTINPADDPVTANDDSYTTPEDTPLNVSAPGVLTNDSYPDGLGTLTVVDDVDHGTLTLNADGSFTYTPDTDYNGTDTFEYKLCDADTGAQAPAECDTATVTLTVTPVDDPVTANDDSYTTPEDTPLNVSAPGVLTNDSYPDGLGTLTVVDDVDHGTLTLNADGSFTYTPDTDYNGTDTFEYKLCDADTGAQAPAECDTATVTLNITPVNDAPTAVDDTATTTEDTPVNIDVLANDTFGGDGPSSSPITVTTNPSHGTATVNDNGTANDPTDDTVDYTPNANYNGTDTFDYQICDSNGDCDTATVTVTITPANDPPVATDDAFTTPEDTPLTGVNVITDDNGNGVDSDPDGDTLTVSALQWDTDGDGAPDSVTVGNTAMIYDASGTLAGQLAINSDGSLTFYPSLNYNGNVGGITYAITDGNGGSDTANVTITITPVNDFPTAVDDTATTSEGTPVNINVLANDTFGGDGPSSSPISVTTNPSHGAATVNDNGTANDPTDDTVDYTPDPGYHGTDTFVYKICDANGDCDTATVTVTITATKADLELAKRVSPANAMPGDTVTFTLTLENKGPDTATNITVKDAIPSGYDTITLTNCAGGSLNGNNIAWNIGSLPNGSSVTCEFTAVVRFGDHLNIAEVTAVDQPDPDSTPSDGKGDDYATAEPAVVFDPPAGWKTVSDAGWPELVWQMVWINNSNTAALNTFIVDPIPSETTYIANSLTCTAHGATVVHQCTYNASSRRIEVRADIAPDPGVADAASAANALTITYRTTVLGKPDEVKNQGRAYWDENGDGKVGSNDSNVSNDDPVLTDDPASPAANDPTRAHAPTLPKTGFPPNRVTRISAAPAQLPYQDMGSVWVEIPRLGVKAPVWGVAPNADLTWLTDVAWMNTTAFPGWVGNSVLTAHNWLASGLPGPFAQIHTLRWGDIIRVHVYGAVYEYQVRQVKYVSPQDISPLKPVNDGYAWLTLLTCSHYDEAKGTYRNRVVVRAVLVKWWHK